MTSLAVIRRSNVLNPLGMRAELEAFSKTPSALIIRIIHRDRLTSIFLHHSEARNIRGTITYIDHVLKGHRTSIARHVVIDVIVGIKQSLVDPEEILGLGSVRNRTLGKTDPAMFVFTELTPKDLLHLILERATIEECLQARRNNIVLHLNSRCFMLGQNVKFIDLFKKLFNTRIVVQAYS